MVACHPSRRAMTGTEAPALSGRLAFVPTGGETLASRRSAVAISAPPPVLPVVRDSLRFRAATAFAASGHITRRTGSWGLLEEHGSEPAVHGTATGLAPPYGIASRKRPS